MSDMQIQVPDRCKKLKELMRKTQEKQKAKPTVQKSGSLITRIQNICSQVQTRLGHYAEELELIQTKERLHEYINACIEQDIISIDTETTGLDPITDQIVGACIYTYGQKAAYIPINHIDYITNVRCKHQLTEQEVGEEFQRLADAKTKIIMFNAKFDIRVIRHQLNVYLTPSWCGFIAGKCLKNNEMEGNLKYLWKKYCSPDKEAEHFTFDKMFSGIKFNLIPISTAYLYAAKDALMTLELYDFQKPYLTPDDPICIKYGLQKLAKLYREIELPIITIVADIEDNGVCIDVNYCKQLSEKYNKQLKEAENAFHDELKNYEQQLNSYLATHPASKLENPINIASPTQLTELFYDVLKQPQVSKKSPRGTGEEVLEKMGHPLGKLILNYRGVAKLLNTYIDKMPAIVNKKTGKIHCSFNQYGTDCIIGDSHLVTNKGVFTFKELLKNICIENGIYYEFKEQILNKDRQWENSAYGIKYNDVDTLKIKGQYGFEIEGTYNHPIMVSRLNYKDWCKNHSDKQLRDFWKDKQFKKLDQLQIGDYIEIPCGWQWPEVDYLQTALQINDLKTHNSQILKAPKYFDEEFAEFLGMYHADGHYRDCKDGFYITISNHSMDVYNRLIYLCKSLFNVVPRREDAGNKEVNLRIKLTHLRDLQKLLSKGALNKRIPEQIRHSNKEVIKAYLKGLSLDSSRNRNQLLISVRNKSDAQFIQMFLCSQGILSGVRDSSYNYKDKSREMYRVAISGQNLNQYLDLIGVVQESKNIYTSQNNRYKNVKIDNSFRIQVKSIEKTKNTVYDINVPETHSFICNSMINHNTGRFSSSDPNLQNIPSHNKDIRKMFVASTHEDIYSQDNAFHLLIEDLVPTVTGDKNAQDLQVGDVLVDGMERYEIKQIDKHNNDIMVYI